MACLRLAARERKYGCAGRVRRGDSWIKGYPCGSHAVGEGNILDMYYYVEEWKPKREWLEMTPEDRGKFLFDHSPAIQSLIDNGAELVGYCVNHNGHHDRTDCFLRVWRLPHKDFVQRINEALERAGWHSFFEAGDTRGEVMTPQVAIPYLVNPER